MRRVFIPALLAVAFVASSSVNASAFGLFDKLCNNGCDSVCCDVEPACGCEAPVACGCAVEPTCGADVCCDSGFKIKRPHLLSRLFHKNHGCDSCVEPACGCEVIEPACGCEQQCAPACGPTCGQKVKGFLKGLFHKHNNCCDAAPCCVEPTCGVEPSCGAGW
ncbi:hypothetical protein Pla52o_49400 [Novipirellula galeiformis]|uniref:Keratin-like protein n=1 Tax=Novipirellula galeiformis TaxID=2528004 RepID=A0A5C6C0K3_9BACT|nr:hypothetical protein Pla52o_49400 [Novipirellula galeiformis]